MSCMRLHPAAALVVLGASVSLAGAARGERLLAVGADAGLGAFGGDAMATLQTGLDIREGNLALGIYARVRLHLSGDEAGGVRERDFDEPSDYLHILRYLHYRRGFGRLQLRVGAGEVLGFTLGDGTLVRDYSNIADPDHPHAGAMLDVTHGPIEVRLAVDNVINPALVAARVGWRPEQLARFSVAASLALDPRAPRRVLLDADGRRQVGKAHNLAVAGEVLALSGLDIAYRFGGVTSARLTPYVAANTSWHGVGMHLGTRGHLPLGDSGVELACQLEYRVTSGGYAPDYVGAFYDVERYQAALNFSDPDRATDSQRETPLSNLHAGRYGGQGVMAQVAVDAGDPAQVKLGYRYHPGPAGHRAWMSASTSPIDALSLGAMIMLHGLGAEMQGADGLAVLAEGRYRVGDYVYAVVQYTRSWALADDTGYFALLQSFNIGLGGTWSS